MPDEATPSVPKVNRYFDWRDELARQERNVTWLSRHTGIHWRRMHRIYNGETPTRDEDYVLIARALGMAGPDGADL